MVFVSVAGFAFVQGERSTIGSSISIVEADASFGGLSEKDNTFDDVCLKSRFEKIWGS